jgi:hypothetical protein
MSNVSRKYCFKNASRNIVDSILADKGLFYKEYSAMMSGFNRTALIFCVPMYFSKLSTQCHHDIRLFLKLLCYYYIAGLLPAVISLCFCWKKQKQLLNPRVMLQNWWRWIEQTPASVVHILILQLRSKHVQCMTSSYITEEGTNVFQPTT